MPLHIQYIICMGYNIWMEKIGEGNIRRFLLCCMRGAYAPRGGHDQCGGLITFHVI